MKNNILRFLVIANVIFFLSCFVIIPHLILLVETFNISSFVNFHQFYPTFNNLKTLLNVVFIRIYVYSIIISISSSVVCLVPGYFFAYIIYISKHNLTKQILLLLTIIPLWNNMLIKIYAITSILSNKGLINNTLIFLKIIHAPIQLIYTQGAIIIGFVYIMIPFITVFSYSSLQKIKNDTIQSAKDLGANNKQIFLKIILPLSYNGIASGYFSNV